jgi:chemotaxis protein CheD
MSSVYEENNRELRAALPGFEHIKRYWDKNLNGVVAKILPGEYYVTNTDEYVTTVLGSCISACIRDATFGVGGMNHFMLPVRDEQELSVDVSAAERYGNYAMEHLINAILKAGGRRENLEVKIFGGGRILAHMTDVGRRNIAFVRDYIHTEGLQLVASDVGNVYPRKVIYHPASGKVRLKKLRSLQDTAIVERETSYLEDLREKPVEGEVDLF